MKLGSLSKWSFPESSHALLSISEISLIHLANLKYTMLLTLNFIHSQLAWRDHCVGGEREKRKRYRYRYRKKKLMQVVAAGTEVSLDAARVPVLSQVKFISTLRKITLNRTSSFAWWVPSSSCLWEKFSSTLCCTMSSYEDVTWRLQLLLPCIGGSKRIAVPCLSEIGSWFVRSPFAVSTLQPQQSAAHALFVLYVPQDIHFAWLVKHTPS